MRDGQFAGIAAWIVLLTLALASSGWATDLTGILLYVLDASDNPVGPFWNTAITPQGRPLGVVEDWFPTQLRGAPLANGTNGEIRVDIPPLPFAHVIAALWQYSPGEFPQRMALNLYFNGDNVTPGISAVVPVWFGLTQFAQNTAPSTFTLYLGEVDNQGSLSFDDGSRQVRLTVAWYVPSGEATYQWRPSDFVDIDRVGVRDFEPDGLPDGIMIFELAIGRSSGAGAPTLADGKAATGSGLVLVPAVPTVGPDEWLPPSTSGSPAAPPGATAAVVATPSVGEEQEAMPTPSSAAASPVFSASVTSREGGGTQTPARTVSASTPNVMETPRETMARTISIGGSGSSAHATATPGVGVRSRQR